MSSSSHSVALVRSSPPGARTVLGCSEQGTCGLLGCNLSKLTKELLPVALFFFFFFQGVMSLAFWGVACFGWGCPCDTVPCEGLLALSNLAALWQTAGAAHKAAPVF